MTVIMTGAVSIPWGLHAVLGVLTRTSSFTPQNGPGINTISQRSKPDLRGEVIRSAQHSWDSAPGCLLPNAQAAR